MEEDVALGRDLSVTGTPTMFIGSERVVGYRPEQILTLIQERIALVDANQEAAKIQ